MENTETTNGSRIFTATYHDTEDGRLARAGIVLRRRMENGKSVWELDVGKTSREADGGPASPPDELLRLLVAPLLGRQLVEIAKTRTPCASSCVMLQIPSSTLSRSRETSSRLRAMSPAPSSSNALRGGMRCERAPGQPRAESATFVSVS